MQFNRRRHSEFMLKQEQLLGLQKRLDFFSALITGITISGLIYLLLPYLSEGVDLQKSSEPPVFLGLIAFQFLQWVLCFVKKQTRPQLDQRQGHLDYDKLTGVLSRQCFEELLDDEIRRVGRYRYALTLCRLDIDHFKSYVENFGQEKANQLLQNFAELIKGTIREADVIARYALDEFCVLLPHTDLVSCEKFIARILTLAQEQTDCSFSAGLTPYRMGENKTQLMMRAHSALDHAKRRGRKRVCCMVGKDEQQAIVEF